MAAEDGDVLFTSQLDGKSKEKAKKELHELNDKDRELAVQTLRQWVLQQDWLKCPTDFAFLLRFLRVRKFSQLGARQTIENYWACKERIPRIYRDIDPGDTFLQDVVKTGFAFSHKKTDSEGCRIIFCQPGCVSLDRVKEIGVHNLHKSMVMVLEWIMMDENAQVNGVRILADYTNMGFQLYLAYAEVEEMKTLLKFLQKSLPVRLKGMFLYNEPTFLDVLLAFVSPFLTSKFKERMKVVGSNLADLYKVMDTSILPDDYLPDDHRGPSAGPISKIIDEMLQDMMQPRFHDYIRDMSSTKYGIDKEKRDACSVAQENVASFRKLNVD